jgi:hypothetical protein
MPPPLVPGWRPKTERKAASKRHTVHRKKEQKGKQMADEYISEIWTMERIVMT